MTVSFAANSLVVSLVTVHLVPLLIEEGHFPAFAPVLLADTFGTRDYATIAALAGRGLLRRSASHTARPWPGRR